MNQIQHLPPNLLRNNKLLTWFSCSFHRISALPTRIFHGLSELRWLELSKNRLENLSEDVFQNLSSLQELDLSENRLTLLHENIFHPLTNLTDLDVSDNNLIKIVGEYPFGSSKHLNYLNLNNAGLTQWPVINWTEYNLTLVDFSNNNFGTVKLPTYTPNRVKIDLSNCKIRTIYTDDTKYAFEMPTYDLSNNEITCNQELQQFVSRFIGNYCPIECECSAETNRVIVNCFGNAINGIPEVLVSNAKIVDLSNNYIKDLSRINCVTWKNVTHLRLSNNSLSRNRLTGLSSGLMNLIDVSPEVKVYLSENNWNCHCHSQFTKDWLVRNRQKIADFVHVFCARNSSFVSSIEIVCNDGCTQIPEDNLASSCDNEAFDSRLMGCLDVKNIREITFTDCSLSGIDFGTFTFGHGIEHVNILLTLHDVPSLTSLRISFSNFTLFPNKPFRMLINLSELYITQGELKVLPEDLFYNLHNLTKLDLSYNNIESIHPLVFRDLTRLEYLDLQWNQINDLPSDMFKNLYNLKTFNISWNRKLSKIPFGFFKELHNLTEINAVFCSISSLEEDTFSDFINLKIVNLGFNQIVHFRQIF
ncbi:slit homolog 1 protein-like [Centruroides vittatus]|uniref:slit homolog 1 protein-like n=1 Tax=Centruroides vittatus TaxID=120091 RepID=UPI00350F32D1